MFRVSFLPWMLPVLAACKGPSAQDATQPPAQPASSAAVAVAQAPGKTGLLAPPAAQRVPIVGTPVEIGGTTKNGKFRVSMSFTVPKVGALFSVVTRASFFDGTPLPADATLAVDATMPQHRHGMMTKPESTLLVPGQWKSDGFSLHMQGQWQFSARISAGAESDELLAPFEQPPEAVDGL